MQITIDVSGLQEQPAPPGESVGPLDHIIQGFKPPQLDSRMTAQFEHVASIQAQLEALAARDTVEAPAVQPPVVSNEGEKDAALIVPAVQAYPMYALPPQEQMPTEAALPSLV